MYSDGDIPRAMLKEKYVFVLSIAVQPDLTEDSFANYDIDNRFRYWYNNKESNKNYYCM